MNKKVESKFVPRFPPDTAFQLSSGSVFPAIPLRTYSTFLPKNDWLVEFNEGSDIALLRSALNEVNPAAIGYVCITAGQDRETVFHSTFLQFVNSLGHAVRLENLLNDVWGGNELW